MAVDFCADDGLCWSVNSWACVIGFYSVDCLYWLYERGEYTGKY